MISADDRAGLAVKDSILLAEKVAPQASGW